jgi:nitrate/nitrite-specific signal transduction histidine kinase
MTDSNDQHEHGAYVREVGERTKRYAHEILEENERLRGLIASLRADEERLREELDVARASSREIASLRERLIATASENQRLSDELQTARTALERHEREHQRLSSQLETVDTDNRRFMDQFVSLEQQNNNLANLYVATYRLHETLDRETILQTLQEILINLVGTEETALFEVSADGAQLELVVSNGIQPEVFRVIPMGVGRIGRAVATDTPYLADSNSDGEAASGEETLTACVPLRLASHVTGAIAIFKLLPQKPGLEALDHELFDLLASQVATALYCTKLHERATRGEI